MNEANYSKKLALKAYAMFRDWTCNAQVYYPALDFTIRDESVLVKDLTHSIQNAKSSLQEESNEERRSTPGFDVGYMLGFIQSNLNAHWIHEYIRKQSPEYQTCMALKALKNYLQFDELALVRSGKIYEHLLQDGLNLEELHSKFPNPSTDELPFLSETLPGEPPLIQTLDLAINQYVLQVYQEEQVQLMEDAFHYFSEEEIRFILGKPIA